MEVYFPVPVQAQGFVDHACCGGSTPWFPQNLGWPLFLGCGFKSSRLNRAAKYLLSSVSWGHKMEERRRSSHREGFWNSACDAVPYILLARL